MINLLQIVDTVSQTATSQADMNKDGSISLGELLTMVKFKAVRKDVPLCIEVAGIIGSKINAVPFNYSVVQAL